MHAHRLSVAKSVAECLFAAEEALDIAAARIAELNARLPLARLEARLAASVGQDAFHRSANALLLIAQTREEIVATHGFLKNASDGIGLTEVGYGDVIKPDSATANSAPSGRLRAAA